MPAFEIPKVFNRGERERLPDDRETALIHKFNVGTQEGYLTVGFYKDGRVAEIFTRLNNPDPMAAGLLACFDLAISTALQYGVPLSVFVEKFSHMQFGVSGSSGNPQVGYAKSVIDYIFRWLGAKFLKAESNTKEGKAK